MYFVKNKSQSSAARYLPDIVHISLSLPRLLACPLARWGREGRLTRLGWRVARHSRSASPRAPPSTPSASATSFTASSSRVRLLSACVCWCGADNVGSVCSRPVDSACVAQHSRPPPLSLPPSLPALPPPPPPPPPSHSLSRALCRCSCPCLSVLSFSMLLLYLSPSPSLSLALAGLSLCLSVGYCQSVNLAAIHSVKSTCWFVLNFKYVLVRVA